MDVDLTIWHLNTFAKDSGFNLIKEGLKEFVPHTDDNDYKISNMAKETKLYD